MKNKIIKFLNKDIVLALLFAIAAVAICYIVSGIFGFHMVYSEKDDFYVEYYIAVGEDKSLFLSYFLTAILVPLQKIFSGVNILILSELIMNFFAFAAFNFVFLSKFRRRYAIFFICITDLLFLPLAFIFLQWTHTAAIACIAGCLLILNAYHKESAKKYRILQIIFGIVLMSFSSFLRFSAFEVVTAVFAVYVACEAIAFLWKQKNDKIIIKQMIKNFTKKYGKIFISFVLIIAALFSLNILSNFIKNSDESYKVYRAYNTARASVVDYNVSEYEENEEFYNSIGIYSANDIAFYRSWHCDDDFFTEERLSAIADYSDQNLWNRKLSISNFYSLVKDKINQRTGLNADLVLVGLAFLVLICLIVLYLFRNKLKLLFPVFWIFVALCYIKIFGISSEYILALPIFVVLIITAFLFNRYHYFVVSCLSVVMLVLIVYLRYSRMLFRTSFTVFLPITLCMLYAIYESRLRKNISKINIKGKRIISVISALVILVVSVQSELIIYSAFSHMENETTNNELCNYMESNEDKIYVIAGSGVRKNYENPLLVPQIPDNAISAYGWNVGSAYNNSKKESFGIEHTYKDVINNESVYLYFYKSVNLDVVKDYYNNHYAEPGYEIEFNLIESFGNSDIYSLVSCKK